MRAACLSLPDSRGRLCSTRMLTLSRVLIGLGNDLDDLRRRQTRSVRRSGVVWVSQAALSASPPRSQPKRVTADGLTCRHLWT